MTENLQPNREVVAVFDSAENLEDAVDDLLSHGFDRAEVSLLATEGAIDERLGHVYRRAEDARDEERTVYVSEDEPGQARKILTGSLAAAGAMAGGALVVATGAGLPGSRAGRRRRRPRRRRPQRRLQARAHP
jgi:hypothetical protein